MYTTTTATQAEILFVFPSSIQARSFVLSERLTSFTYNAEKKLLRCVCTPEQAETAVNTFYGTMLDVRPSQERRQYNEGFATLS